MKTGNASSSTPLTVEEELAKVNEYLDSYEINCWLPQTINENTVNEATKLLNIDFTTFKYTAEECALNALILTQFAFNLNRVINKEKGSILWANNRIDKVIGPLLKKQTAYGKEERRASAISESELAKKLFELKTVIELRLVRIESLYFSVKNTADKFELLAKTTPRER